MANGDSGDQITAGVGAATAVTTGAATVGAATGLAAVAASATLIGGIVVGVVLLIQTFRGTAHLVANDIVDNLENPFGRALAQIVDEKDKAIREKYATAALIRTARDGVARIWADYQLAAQEYGRAGGAYDLVARQSLNNLNGPNPEPPMPAYFINGVLEKMDREAANVPLSVFSVLGTSDKRIVVGIAVLALFLMVALVFPLRLR